MTEKVFIRAEIMDVLPSGQKAVHLLANNADGIMFYTESIVKPQEIIAKANKEFAQRLINKINCIPQHHFTLASVLFEIDKLVKEMGAEVVHGEWLRTDAYPHRVYCSSCYATYVTNEEVIRGRNRQHCVYCTEAEFCPHCGAKMDGKRSEPCE